MRKKLLMAIYDDKAEMFSEFPLPAVSEADAIRAFTYSINAPDSMHSRHPLDYSLWLLGDYDIITGTITCLEKAKLLTSGKDVLRKEPDNGTLPFQKED